MNTALIIRPVKPGDNPQIHRLVLAVLEEFGCVGTGYASSDPELLDMFGTYRLPKGQKPDRGYWVIEDLTTGQVLGGGGFSPLKGYSGPAPTCELQKVYFHPSLRGRGFGRKLLETCVQEAEQRGYETMYLETIERMSSAIGLYQKMGFRILTTRLGQTGHSACSVFMSRPLRQLALVGSC
ncbi:GNAT family N-acetyltransferase [Vampirovibrio sp.]|uniref:GNAT family N-acetyltransferase n=1 Tax=Vampirovibrio sp. TaxID=2717857 RepID=UPI00359330F8